jgi:predicted nucleic acid-binding protein
MEPSFPGGVSFRYIETSALVAAGLEGDATAVQAIRGEGLRIASALTLAETRRTFAVAIVRGRLSQPQVRSRLAWLRRFERRCEIIDVSSSVLSRLGRPFPVEPVRSLDAIHLATIEMLEVEPSLVAVVTRDRRVRENALAMGYVVE